MFVKKVSLGLLAVALVSGCSTHGGPIKKSHLGTAIGAAGGAIAGSNIGKGKGNIVAIAAGTLLGAAIGHEVGASLDRADLAYMRRNNQKALENLPIGQTSTWKNPDSGRSGSITPVKTYQVAGRYCREFSQTINIGGETQEGYGKACRQPDGSWEIQQ